jgi:4-diphosphocytidyl-2-C-methyl-D-erythritol kinase
MLETTLTLPAFAKINLSLRILSKRADGYHEIDTVFQTISLHDTITLTVTAKPEIVLSCDDHSLPTDSNNLVVRAAEALQARFAPDKGARIHLAKRIPSQAGLGGGSSDSAVTLIGLAHLWEIELTAKEFLELASELGADSPFFLYGGRAHGRGIGTDLTPLEDTPERFLLVLKPSQGICTMRAYARLMRRYACLTTSEAKTILSSSERSEISDNFNYKALQNDFEPAVFEIEPEIERAKVALMKAGAEVALLAGSGSAVFGIFDNQDAQKRAIPAIELEPGWRVFLCWTVGRSNYRNRMGSCGAVLQRFTGP